MKFALSLLASLSFVSAHAEAWPGLPPDCWSEPRNFHEYARQDPWQENVVITQVKAEKPKPGVYSPNEGYYFVYESNWSDAAKLTIYAEKDHLTQIKFSNIIYGRFPVETKWITEKLLLMRPWWGMILATDIIFDVEKEKVIYSESLYAGGQAYQQFQESCPQTGCQCIKRK